MNKNQKFKSKIIFLYLKAYLPVVSWAGMIFYLSTKSTLPSFNTSLTDFLFKKLAHIFVYAVLYYLIFRAYLITHSNQKLNNKHYILPLVLSLIYAISDELHQSKVQGRYSSVRDIGYDCLGMVSVLLHQQKLL